MSKMRRRRRKEAIEERLVSKLVGRMQIGKQSSYQTGRYAVLWVNSLKVVISPQACSLAYNLHVSHFMKEQHLL